MDQNKFHARTKDETLFLLGKHIIVGNERREDKPSDMSTARRSCWERDGRINGEQIIRVNHWSNREMRTRTLELRKGVSDRTIVYWKTTMLHVVSIRKELRQRQLWGVASYGWREEARDRKRLVYWSITGQRHDRPWEVRDSSSVDNDGGVIVAWGALKGGPIHLCHDRQRLCSDAEKAEERTIFTLRKEESGLSGELCRLCHSGGGGRWKKLEERKRKWNVPDG